MSSSVDQIKSKIDIVSLVSNYIKLEKAGSNFKGRCPFHNEKTPSFFVSPDRGSYYCFGCHAKGDVFTFVQEFEGLDFIGSLKVLAEKAGVELDQYSSSDKTEKNRLHEVLEMATIFFQNNLGDNNVALEYLKNRGIEESTIKNWRIGFSSLEWRDLFTYLSGKGVSEQDMLAVGLVKRKEGSTSCYDVFRGRIMFPINDSSGRVVGFSGRILVTEENSPKYLNSPETILFNKSEILFGLDKAKNSIKIKDYSILVEGQMDLIMLHQIGIANTVASSGTALTENQLKKLQRLSNRIIMAYDGDEAGFSASRRSSQIALQLGMDLKVATMKSGTDPADLAKDNPALLKEVLTSSKHIIDFYMDGLIEKGFTGRKLGQEVEKNVLPYVAMLTSSIEQAHFVKTISQKMFIKEEALWDELKKANRDGPRKESPPTQKKSEQQRVDHIEKKILGIIWWQRSKKDRTLDLVEIERRVGEILEERLTELEEFFEKNGQKEELLFETESYYDDKEGLDKEVKDLILSLEEEYLKQRFGDLMGKLKEAEVRKDKTEIDKYLRECQEIGNKINLIKQQYEK
ncbi:MAG: DNA primase [Patescibacteria group bacterium]